jgi:predicted GNAT superfamily acetyltransferase
MPIHTYRDLTTLEEFAAVVELERRIWGPGYDEVVPVPILAVTVRRGGILIGAFAGARLVGFVYSLAGLKDGVPTQWSHMLGVVDEQRNDGIGFQLKVLQRDRVLARGLDLVEWTFDPMQAMNAYFNFAKLGVIVQDYEPDVYGASTSPLHRGNPTDRFVAEWLVRTPRVDGRLAGSAPMAPAVIVERANRTARSGEWREPVDENLSLDARRVSVEIPIDFTGMLSRAPGLALEWRMVTREIFGAYLTRGYRVVEFFLDRPGGTGAYLLVQAQDAPGKEP